MEPGEVAIRRRDAELVERARSGDELAFGRLYDFWFDRVFNLTERVLHEPAAAADAAQDTFLAAWRNLERLEQPESFGGWLLRIARNTAFNVARKERRSRAADEEELAVIEQTRASLLAAPAGFGVEDRAGAFDDPVRAVEDDEVVTLLWEAAEALGERDAEVLDLHLRHGMTPAEIGETIGVTRNNANQLVHRVKQRLGVAVGARVLWRRGAPACDELRAALQADGVERFDGRAVRIADSHVVSCEACRKRQAFRLEPAHLFAVIPFVAAPLLLKQQAAHALAVAGVPMAGSRHAGEWAQASTAPLEVSAAPSVTPSATPGPGARGARVQTIAMVLTAGTVILALLLVLAGRLEDGVVENETLVSTVTTRAVAPSTTTSSSVPPGTTEPEAPSTTVAPSTTTTTEASTTTTTEPSTTPTVPPKSTSTSAGPTPPPID